MKAPMKKLLLTIVTMFVLTGCDESTQLHTGLSEREANEVLAELMASGIDTTKQMTKNGVNVLVAKNDIAPAVRILRAVGLPRRDKVSMGEVFKKEGIISTPIEERARYIHAISQEIEHTLSQIDGVVLARVHVVLPQKVSPVSHFSLHLLQYSSSTSTTLTRIFLHQRF
ncbi:EscJ/YscJ/HrcJ family type III secretion inner membrane ring protein [Veronia nyctiphanis]|uniref:Lipoprotein n=2 Tax=Veronia nyctiphanis TaxID=1278244 RepID=A0A4Q0YP35_9GAMM|nr:EscJ/YscJ/HrcJ family type III secretion inner membrane ring protein [Veronia nyctiphanis]